MGVLKILRPPLPVPVGSPGDTDTHTHRHSKGVQSGCAVYAEELECKKECETVLSKVLCQATRIPPWTMKPLMFLWNLVPL